MLKSITFVRILELEFLVEIFVLRNSDSKNGFPSDVCQCVSVWISTGVVWISTRAVWISTGAVWISGDHTDGSSLVKFN